MLTFGVIGQDVRSHEKKNSSWGPHEYSHKLLLEICVTPERSSGRRGLIVFGARLLDIMIISALQASPCKSYSRRILLRTLLVCASMRSQWQV